MSSPSSPDLPNIPIIDVSPFLSLSPESPPPSNSPSLAASVSALRSACQNFGFFYATEHGIPRDLQEKLEELSKKFFALPLEEKLKIPMSAGGRAWRGFFPVGDELTSGKPDLKEGLYFGQEISEEDERVKQGRPLFGKNLFPPQMPEFGSIVLAYMAALRSLGFSLMRGLALSLGLPCEYFTDRFLSPEPLELFRIFNYPPASQGAEGQFGVGKHTDYGLLTILKQDSHGGLEVQIPSGDWIQAPPVENSFICNLGDILQVLSCGQYISTPHRVRNLFSNGSSRLSWPYFFDPAWDAEIIPLPIQKSLFVKDEEENSPENAQRAFIEADQARRWDSESPNLFQGIYGDYLLKKVGKVFPTLKSAVLK